MCMYIKHMYMGVHIYMFFCAHPLHYTCIISVGVAFGDTNVQAQQVMLISQKFVDPSPCVQPLYGQTKALPRHPPSLCHILHCSSPTFSLCFLPPFFFISSHFTAIVTLKYPVIFVFNCQLALEKDSAWLKIFLRFVNVVKHSKINCT